MDDVAAFGVGALIVILVTVLVCWAAYDRAYEKGYEAAWREADAAGLLNGPSRRPGAADDIGYDDRDIKGERVLDVCADLVYDERSGRIVDLRLAQ